LLGGFRPIHDPAGIEDPTAPPSFTLLGAISVYVWTNLTPTTPAPRLRLLFSRGVVLNLLSRLFSSQFHGRPPAHPASLLQLGCCGVLRSTRYPCHYLGCNRTPEFVATRSGFKTFAFVLPDLQPLWSDTLRRMCQAALSACAAGTRYPRGLLDPSSARLAFLSRDPAACSGLHATPASTTEISLGFLRT